MIEIKRLHRGDEELAQEIVKQFWPEGQLNDECLKKETNYLLAAMKLYRSTDGKRMMPDNVLFIYKDEA